jgi:hypothetical protein
VKQESSTKSKARLNKKIEDRLVEALSAEMWKDAHEIMTRCLQKVIAKEIWRIKRKKRTWKQVDDKNWLSDFTHRLKNINGIYTAPAPCFRWNWETMKLDKNGTPCYVKTRRMLSIEQALDYVDANKSDLVVYSLYQTTSIYPEQWRFEPFTFLRAAERPGKMLVWVGNRITL